VIYKNIDVFLSSPPLCFPLFNGILCKIEVEQDSERYTTIMLTIYAKNMAGEIQTLSVSSGVTAETIRRILSPDDPSSVRLLSRTPRVKEEVPVESMTEDALQEMMEELHAMAYREEEDEEEEEDKEQEEDKEEEEESLEYSVWQDGDTVEYWMEAEELTVCLTPPMGGPYYACSDPEDRWPLYPFTIWLEKEEGGEKRSVFQWMFLFSLREGLYFAPSEFAMEVEGGGGDVYLALRTPCVVHNTLFGAIRTDSDIPARYKEKMLRAIYRKWTRTLRMMARRSLEERRVRAMYGTEYLEGERALFKQHYYTLRAMKHDVAGRNE
jgi:hypothetical protein